VAAAPASELVSPFSAPIKVAAAKAAPVEGPVDTIAVVKAPPVVAASDAPAVPARVVRVAPVLAAVAKPVAAPAPPKRARGSSDPDMEAASAASDLAKAQLEASLR
jgi:hypothetical protein